MRKRYRVNDLEKVFQLSGLVKRQSERKARIAKDFQDYRAKSVSRQDTRLFKRLKKSEKLRRVEEFKEDLRLGPLAPRRDVGPDREFAAINQTLFSPNDVDEATRISRWPFEPGDRVVILQGPDKGKIGILDSCDISNQSVKVRDMNLVCQIHSTSSSSCLEPPSMLDGVYSKLS